MRFFNPQCAITLGRFGEPGVRFSSENFHIEFESSYEWGQTTSTAKAKIYNPAPKTLDLVKFRYVSVVPLVISYAQCVVEAGYGENISTAYIGSIVNWDLSDPPDRVLTLDLSDNAYTFMTGLVNESYAGPISARAVLSAILSKYLSANLSLGIATFGEEKTWARGVSFFGQPLLQVLNLIAAETKSIWGIRNGIIFFEPINPTPKAVGVLLNAGSGLIGWPKQTERGWKLKSMFNGDLFPGGDKNGWVLTESPHINEGARTPFKIYSVAHKWLLGGRTSEIEVMRPELLGLTVRP